MTAATGRKSAIIIQRLQTEVATLRESLAAVSVVDVHMLGKKLRSANHDITRMRVLNSELLERVSSLEKSLFEAVKSSKAQSIHTKLMFKVNHSRGGGTGTGVVMGSNRVAHDIIGEGEVSRCGDHKSSLPIMTSGTITVDGDCDIRCNSDSDDVFCDTNDDETNTTIDGISEDTLVTVPDSPIIMTLKSQTKAPAVSSECSFEHPSECSSGCSLDRNSSRLCNVLPFLETSDSDSIRLNETQRQAIVDCDDILKGEAKGADKSRYAATSVGALKNGIVGVEGGTLGTFSRSSCILLGTSGTSSASEESECSNPESEHPSCSAYSCPTITSVSSCVSASPRIRRAACGVYLYVFLCSIVAVILGAAILIAIGVNVTEFNFLSDG